MLPASFQMPAAIILLLGGLLSCFAGYRVFRVVLGIYGFVLGALLASSLMGTDQTVYMIVAALVGGVVGALILIGAYFVGVALIGAGFGALIVNFIWAPSAASRTSSSSSCSRSPARSARWRCSATSSSRPPRSAAPGR